VESHIIPFDVQKRIDEWRFYLDPVTSRTSLNKSILCRSCRLLCRRYSLALRVTSVSPSASLSWPSVALSALPATVPVTTAAVGAFAVGTRRLPVVSSALQALFSSSAGDICLAVGHCRSCRLLCRIYSVALRVTSASPSATAGRVVCSAGVIL
jgi:hypothetical protein